MVDSGIAPRVAARRSSLLGAAALAFTVLVMLFAMPAAPASASCTTGGTSCLPAAGYTGDDIWNCGTIGRGTNCYYGSGASLHFGWGSASSDSSTFVCIVGQGFFSGCGLGLARACYQANCDDQDAFGFPMYVNHTYGSGRVVHGHTKW